LRIKALHIYGFGKLENVMIDRFSPEIQVIYGQNEAGKSTIMAFIHAIFFGFPAKSQNELRYEPKRVFKYGGKISVETKAERILTIDRVAGRAAGDHVAPAERVATVVEAARGVVCLHGTHPTSV
jgi:uncharacterized protein YhaN